MTSQYALTIPSTVATSAARGATAGTSTCRRAGVWALSATGRRSARGTKRIGWRRDMRSPRRMEGCPNLLEPDRHAQSDRAGSQRQQGQEQREGEPEPVLIADLRGREDREERAVRRCEQLAQAASVLIREQRDLARQPEQVREGHEDRQGEHGVTAGTGHRYVDQAVHDHHPA